MSSTSITAASGRESARARAVVLLPAAGGPVSRRGLTVTTLALPLLAPAGTPQWPHVVPTSAARTPAPGGGGRPRPVSAARRVASPSSPTARTPPSGTTVPPDGISSGCTDRNGTAATSTPQRPSGPRSPGSRPSAPTPSWPCRTALSAVDGSTTVEVSAAGETRVCSVLRWMDGQHPRVVPSPDPPPPPRRGHGPTARPGRCVDTAGRLRPHPLGPRDVLRRRHDLRQYPGRRVLGPAADRGPNPVRGRRRPTGRGDAAGQRRRTHPRRPAPRQRTLPTRRGQADRLRRLRHRPPSVRARRCPLGAARQAGPGRVPRRPADRLPHPPRRRPQRTWTTSSPCARSPSISGSPARPRSTRRSPRSLDGVHRWSLEMLDLVEAR